MTYKVQLDVFEGPLDLLLYLIKKDEFDIHDIPIGSITDQYLKYLNLMQLLDLNIAGEFLVMAATLMQIKSRMLLPPEETPAPASEEADPRAELVARLLEYKRFKEAAARLHTQEEERARHFTRGRLDTSEIDAGDSPFFEASLFDLIAAFSKILKKVSKNTFHEVIKDEFTVAGKVHELFHLLLEKKTVLFSALFKRARNKFEVITIFLALLELIRLKEVEILQNRMFDDIEIRRHSTSMTAPQLTDATYDRVGPAGKKSEA